MQQQPFTYRDGSQSTFSIYPSSQTTGEIVLVLPALGVRASYYKDLADMLSSASSMTVVSCDWRGHGLSNERPKRGLDYGYEDYVKDVDEALAWIQSEWKGKKITALGHSLGGQIACLHKARFPQKIDRIILSASCSLYPANWPADFRWRMQLAGRLLPVLGDVFGYYPGNMLGFGGREFRTVMKDWGKSTHKGEYWPRGSTFDYEAAMALQAPEFLAITYSKDYWVPLKAVEHLIGKFHPDTQATYEHIEGFGHFDWAKKPEKVVDVILQHS